MRTNKLHVLFKGFMIMSILMLMSCSQDKSLSPDLAQDKVLEPPEVEGLTSEVSLSKKGKGAVADMNDRFAVEKTGANGFATVRLTQKKGKIKVGRVEVKGLLPKHDYLLNVTVTPPGGEFPADIILFTKRKKTDKRGKFKVRDFKLGKFEKGTHRVDIFVTHKHTTTGTQGFPFLGGRDPLSACAPAFFVEVK